MAKCIFYHYSLVEMASSSLLIRLIGNLLKSKILYLKIKTKSHLYQHFMADDYDNPSLHFYDCFVWHSSTTLKKNKKSFLIFDKTINFRLAELHSLNFRFSRFL